MNYTNFTQKELNDFLNSCREYYYNENKSIISDYEYDELFDKLKLMEKKSGIIYTNSPTINVGCEVCSELKKIKHKFPLLSLDKTKSINDIVSFTNPKQNLVLSAKLDGLTCCLTYYNGELLRAETRGDGITGEIITHNAKVFSNIPLTIPYTGFYTIVGEAIIDRKTFESINAKLSEDNKFKNPRNLASGTVRQLNSNICKQRNIKFIAWEVKEGTKLNSHYARLEEARNYGFDIVMYKLIKSTEYSNIENSINTIKDNMAKANIPIDGIVVTVDDIEVGKLMGKTEHHFKNAIAYKFYDEEVVTTLRDIEWSPSRTGQLTPVAIFDTVEIDGTDVSRASLHNLSIINNLHLHIGDEITVYKANQIIPQVKDNLSKHNYTDNELVPAHCPYCGSETRIVTLNDSSVLYCSNDNCTSRLVNKLVHFVSKPCMNIMGLSDATLEQFVKLGWIKSPIDIYTELSKHYKELVTFEGWGDTSVLNLRTAIEQSKENVELYRFITALGIDKVGTKISKELARVCDNDINNFMELEYNDIITINGFGDEICSSIINYINKNQNYVFTLANLMNFAKNTDITKANNKISGKTFVITGKLVSYKNRNELVNVIESNGGTVAGSVSSKTNYLINNDVSSTSGKNKKAKELNIPIIGENDFIDMLS